MARPVASAKPKPRRFWDTNTFYIGLFLTFLVGLLVYENTHDSGCMGFIWLGGLVLIIAIAGKVRW